MSLPDGSALPMTAELPKRLWVPVLATVLPLLLVAILGIHWLSKQAGTYLDTRLASENRHLAAALSQRVAASHQLLIGLEQAGTAPAPGTGGGVWASWAVANLVDGQAVGGDPAIWRLWQQAAPSAVDSSGASKMPAAGLRWVPAATDSGRARVLLAVAGSDSRLWLAELAPNYLWAGLEQPESGVIHCVLDARQQPVNCPAQPVNQAENQSSSATPASLRRSLSFPPELSAGPWLIQTRDNSPTEPAAEISLMLRTLALVGVIGMIVSCGLVMRHWKRSALSLGQILDVAHHWTEQDWAARVEVHPTDDFHGLAMSLNQLADRTGHKLRASQIQSAIDREILGGLDIPRVMRLVVDRLQALLPKARVAVLVVEPSHEGQSRWVIHRSGQNPVHAQAGEAPTVLSDDDWSVTLRAAPAASSGPAQPNEPVAAWETTANAPNRLPHWASKALGVPHEWLNLMLWVPVRRHGQPLAYLALGSRVELEINSDVYREIQDLRDRVAVALTSAARESALMSRAIHDGLTGLFNRIGLQDATDALISQNVPFSLVLVDLDRFKEVNDTLGHQAGDELLCAVAGRLRECVSPQARIARPGGDEFVLLLPGSVKEATASAMAICAELARPFPLRGVQQQIGGSLGLAAFPEQAQTRGELLRRADLAMYVSKNEGRGRFSWYAEAMDERIARRAWMTQELRTAVERAHFTLQFQPRVEAVGGRVISAEALLRWKHAQRGWISPTEFVPAAEESGLIDQLGAWVLASAFQQMREWRDAGVPLHRVAVNVSARQLMTPGFSERVLDLMNRYQLTPADIELELTESVFAGDVDQVCRVLEPLRSRGMQLALDDFGTGYSSLSSLYRLPVDVIKIDHSFVRDLGLRPSAEIMARSIVALAKALNKRVVAEGVETIAQRDQLVSLGCDELQGYLYGKPLEPGPLVKRIEELSAAIGAPPSVATAHAEVVETDPR